MDKDRIAEIQERLLKASPGPWMATKRILGVVASADPSGTGRIIAICDPRWGEDSNPMLDKDKDIIQANADFVAHSPDDIMFLLNRVAALTDALKKFADRESWWLMDREDIIAWGETSDVTPLPWEVAQAALDAAERVSS